MPRFDRPALIIAMLLGTGAATACDCALQRVPVEPIASGRHDIYVGKASTLELRFHNDSAKAEVDVFPEPPLTIGHPATGATCDIDGGIWVRQAVYLSRDEKTLLVQEYSGSNDQLVMYDTATCRKTGEIDVSGARWKITADRISIGRQCSGDDIGTCQQVKQVSLDHTCKPVPTDANK